MEGEKMEDIERVEKVEQLVKKTGCSYSDAKAALERSGWNVLDALIEIEDSKATFVESEVIDRDDAHKYKSADFNMNPNEKHFKDIGGNAESEAGSQKGSGRGGAVKNFFTRLWDAITKNYLNLYNKSDKLLLHVPVIVPVILFLIQFWLMLGLCVVLLLIGFRFQFEGADLGKSTINSAMDNAANAAYNAGQRMKAEFSNNSDGHGGSDIFNTDAGNTEYTRSEAAAGESESNGDYGNNAANN